MCSPRNDDYAEQYGGGLFQLTTTGKPSTDHESGDGYRFPSWQNSMEMNDYSKAWGGGPASLVCACVRTHTHTVSHPAPGDGFAGILNSSDSLQQVPYTPAPQQRESRLPKTPHTADYRLNFTCEFQPCMSSLLSPPHFLLPPPLSTQCNTVDC